MKCPQCGDELRRGTNDPSFGFCDECMKKYKWVDEHKDMDYEFVDSQYTGASYNQKNVRQPRVQNVRVNTQYVRMVSPKSKGVAFMLCLFGGMLGLHKFYVGKIGGGLLYLFTAGLFGIGWIIDIFAILGGGFKDSDGFPLK